MRRARARPPPGGGTRMSRRAFGQSMLLWLYLSLGGAAVMLLHNGPDSRFWMLMLAAGACWLGLECLARAQRD